MKGSYYGLPAVTSRLWSSKIELIREVWSDILPLKYHYIWK